LLISFCCVLLSHAISGFVTADKISHREKVIHKNDINMKKKQNMVLLTCAVVLCMSGVLTAQQEAATVPQTKTGLTFGLLPAISYSSDLGFQYGGLVNFYQFGDGSSYPKYFHSLYLEWSRYTKGSGIQRIFYDSEYLITGIRVTADLCYLPDQALDFYGFNGYEAVYHPSWEDAADSDYRSRMFYRHQRNTFKFTTDFQGTIHKSGLGWVAGLGIMQNSLASVDLERLNKGKDDADKLPDIPGLYDKYVEWGIIAADEKDGGWSNNIKLGLVFDTRDFDPNPMKGIWSEVVLLMAPGFLGNGNLGFTCLSATHRQYFTLVKDKLSFVYRVSAQSTIAGRTPFFMQPYLVTSFNPSAGSDGLGGSKSVRGMLRNRVVGDAIAFGNAEFRWKVYRTMILNQNLYLALNFFTDAGRVIKNIDFPLDGVPEAERDLYFSPGDERLHHTAGVGLRVVLNENFIVAIDHGRAFDRRDGRSGTYIGLNFLF
jgi:hypothetical protein